MDYLDQLPHARQEKIVKLQEQMEKRLSINKKGFLRYRVPFESLEHLKASFLNFCDDTVFIGKEDELSAEDRSQVYNVMRDFMPWRKGPFNVFGIHIDSEWQSYRKWNRLEPFLPDLKDKIIADIGCSNGYYMFRMIPYAPRLVIGFEPYLLHYYCFRTLNSLAEQKNLFIEPLGVEHIDLFEQSFDVVFLMGILYHRSSPIDALRDIRKSLRPGGTIIVESQGIPGEEPTALFPETRYGKVPGTYFVPTSSCLRNWLIRAGFKNVSVFCTHPMSNLEQRRTEWMEFESYDDFIDPHDPSRTVEGYPAPIRIFAKGINE